MTSRVEHRRKVPAPAFALLAIVLLGGLLSFAFETVEVETEGRPSPEVRANPFFALQILLAETFDSARSGPSPTRLPPPESSTVWWLASSHQSGPDVLLDWVERGGHLVMLAFSEAEDPFLEQLGVSTFDEDMADEDDHLARPDFSSLRPDWPRLWVEGENVAVLHSEGPPDAAWTLTIGWGEGQVTVLPDVAFLRNDQLGERDHALIAWTLAGGTSARSDHFLVLRDPSPSVWRLLGSRAVPVAWSLLALAGAFLRFSLRRVGPVIPSQSPERRHLGEHLAATGRYLWSIDRADVLLAAQRSAIERADPTGGRALTRPPEDPSPEDLAVQRALDLRDTSDRTVFTHTVRTLENLRRRLEHRRSLR